MSSKYLETCDPNFIPLVSSTSSSFTTRRALDPTGRLGSFYDAAYDQMLPLPTLQCNKQSIRSRSPASCSAISVNSQDARNLLKWYNIHDELRLSVALQLVERVGIADMINHSHPIDPYTRVISYEYSGQTDCVPDDEFDWLRRHKKPMLDIRATHVTVLVNWGVCAVAILQLPPDPKTTLKIDNALNKLCGSLRDERIILSPDDEQLLRQIHHTEVFSNIPVLNSIRSVVDFDREISRVKNDRNLQLPCNYHLCSIESFYYTSNGMGRVFMPVQKDRLDKIEDYLLFLSSRMQKFTAPTGQTHAHVKRYLNEYYRKVSQKWSNIMNNYKEEIRRLRYLVTDMRRGRIDHRTMDEVLKDDQHNKLIQNINDLHDNLSIIREKEALIQGLVFKGLQYRNANTYAIQNDDNLEIVKQKLLKDVGIDRFILFDDNVIKENKAKWDQLVSNAMKERSEYRSQLTIFVDFTYCTYKLEKLSAVRRTKKTVVDVTPSTIRTSAERRRETASVTTSTQTDDNPALATISMTTLTQTIATAELVTTSTQTATIEGSPRTTSVSTSPLLNDDDTINILLLGESGVGKSTFINAFANYLAFDTLQQAQFKPLVLMSISFLTTVGDDFEEKQVTFDVQDDLNNEDYSGPGQPVTQHCKSYIFTLIDSENRKRKLRLIDTPGIGNVRGVAQDDINMQHILSYLNNLSHLNGVCILMKPTNAQLSIYSRSYFIQLIDYLGESIRDRIMFCFTNSRVTFYTPGDTGPLVKQLLKSLPVQGVPFLKTNTFCFDSESFRYLGAKQNGIVFDESEEQDYQESWHKSSTESKRLLQYIGTKLSSPLLFDEGRSIINAQLQITLLVRPILETIRNIHRNIILSNAGSQTTSIELQPKTIYNSSAICLRCSRKPRQYGDFWIIGDPLHVFYSRCSSCDCDPSDHYRIDYQLNHALNVNRRNHSNEEMIEMVNKLCQTSAEFAHFLVSASDVSKNDLFGAGIERMIKDENDICMKKSSSPHNRNLVKSLEQVKRRYEETMRMLSERQEHIDRPTVYRKIDEVSQYPMIRSQVTAAKNWHKLMMKHYEQEVPL